jgi:ubiquinone/menaquinone biosynthesis C-methylase UbiE
MVYRAKGMYGDESVAASYDRARFTSLRGRLVDRLEKRLALRALALVPAGARVLDVPIGTGRMARLMTSRGYDVVGADISLAMLRQAQARGDVAPLLLADAEQLPFPTGAFDAVLAVRLMFHVPPPIRVAMLAEFKRVSRDIVVVGYANRWTASSVIRRLRAGRGRRYIYPASHGEVVAEAARAGLRVVDDWPLLPLTASSHFFALRRTD